MSMNKDALNVLGIIVISFVVLFTGCVEEKEESFQLKLEGVLVSMDVDKDTIIEQKFNKLLNDSITMINSNDESVTFVTKKPVSEDIIDSFMYNYGESTVTGNRVTLKTTKKRVICSFLGDKLESDVVPTFYNGTEMYEIRKNVSLKAINNVLAQVNGSVASKNGKPIFIEGVSPETMDLVIGILKDRIEMFHFLQNVRFHKYGNSIIIVDAPSMFVADAMDILGETGKFELRIKTEVTKKIKANESYSNITKISKHVLYGDSIKNGSAYPEKSGNIWVVPLQLSETGAIKFREAAIKTGLVEDPSSHEVIMLLNEKVIFFAPFSPELAEAIKDKPIYNLVMSTGTGDEEIAKGLILHLRASMLPVNAKVVQSAELSVL